MSVWVSSAVETFQPGTENMFGSGEDENASIAGGVWSRKEITLVSGQMYIRKRINGLRNFRRIC